MPPLPPAEETLAAAAEAARTVVRTLLSNAREAELRIVFSEDSERVLREGRGLPKGHRPLAAAAVRSFLGDRLHREAPDLFSQAFEPGRLGSGSEGGAAFALSGPLPSWNGGEAVVRVRTWDPGGELLPAFLIAAASGLAAEDERRLRSFECDSIRRLDSGSLLPEDANPAAGTDWRLSLTSPLQLQEWFVPAGGDREDRVRRLARAAGVTPGRLARAAWLRLAELSRCWGGGAGLRLEAKFVDSPVFAALAAAIDAVSPAPRFCDEPCAWRSRHQRKVIHLSGITGVWPREAAWSREAAAAALGGAAVGLLDALWRAATVFQIGRKTAYGCGAVERVETVAARGDGNALESAKMSTATARETAWEDGFSEQFSLAVDSSSVICGNALEGAAPRRGG